MVIYYVCAFDRWSKYTTYRMRSSNRPYHRLVASSLNFALLLSIVVVLDVLVVSEKIYIYIVSFKR